jgi:Spy/CpxP family protein refolding chaperone
MKHAHKHIIAAALLAGFGLAATAQTAAPAGPGAPQAAAREGHGRFDPAKMQERMARRLAHFKQKLNLSPGQEGAWSAYAEALKPTRMQRPDRGEFARLTTPERIDRMRAMRSDRIAEMDKRGDATKTFYASLTPEQKKVFDQETLRGRGEGRHGHHKG